MWEKLISKSVGKKAFLPSATSGDWISGLYEVFVPKE